MEVTPPMALHDNSYQTESGTGARQAVISVEFVAYMVLALLALVLRLGDIDLVPLNDAEARQALAAWRVVETDADGPMVIPDSPLLFLLHSVAFTAMGGSELSARLLTVLAGAALVISPVLFRDLLGRTRAFLLSVLLLTSPVLLLASRSSSPAVWSLLCVVLLLWALWRYWTQRQMVYALLSAALLVSLVLLIEPAGFVLALVLLGAGAASMGLMQIDETENDMLAGVRQWLRDWPLRLSLIVAVLTVVVIGTGFMFYQQGLTAVGQVIGEGLSGFGVGSQADTPVFFPLVASLFYEPALWLFGLIGLVMALRSGWASGIDRFMAAWLVLGGLATLIYGGAGPEHALWLTLPLAGLASSVFASLLTEEEQPQWVADGFMSNRVSRWRVPAWSKWVIALIVTALLIMLLVHIQNVARVSLQTNGGSLAEIVEQLQQRPLVMDSIKVILITVLALLMSYFLAAGLFGNRTAAQGIGLGLLLLGIVGGLGSGWRASTTSADSPVEVWHMSAPSKDLLLLRETLVQLAERESRGFLEMPMTVVTDNEVVLPDGAAAWAVRDFINTTFVTDYTEARDHGIVLMRELPEPPALGVAYVGQLFTVEERWNSQSMLGFDALAWWLQRRARSTGDVPERAVLWLRQDIYNGVPADAQGNVG